ncbi:SNF1-related protein kinase regulatory subunit gamma-1-like [Tetrabaena socialis]|uniref:SNF1-related protein kinase regulatory subunit gamma-1-like n=1 Tax=Tetrabaena socialis TaxID=47790 RepID=A0A2J8AJW1_9CHLO|nr:SNF1-related protein kinase regulatory subunit gamma-1-like [Tetrabaena socialis]|eukprot:PNH12790.1 SNF1-related protein kinase regulatory subunit gamma-1-like [Tetrabaena socialis]
MASALFSTMRDWLASESLQSFVQSHQHAIVALKKEAPLGAALQVLADNKILSVPVLDEEGEYLGAFSVGDALRVLMLELESQLGHGWFDRLSAITAAELDAVGSTVCLKKVHTATHPGDLWLKGDAKTTVLTVIKEGFQVLEPKGHHRIFVVDPAKAHTMTVSGQTVVINIKPGTEKPEASGLRPTDIVSQLDVVKLLAEHKDKLELVMDKTLEDLEIFEGSVFTVHASATALEAFHHMALDHKSCLGIVDNTGKLIGNVSVSDLRFLGPQHWGLLSLTVAEFSVVAAGKGPSPEEAIKGTRVAGAADNKWSEVLKVLPLPTLKPSSTFGQLLETMAAQGLHRIYITDDDGKPVSIVTLTDVLREIIKPEPPVHHFKRMGTNDLPDDDDEEDEDDDEDDEEEAEAAK